MSNGQAVTQFFSSIISMFKGITVPGFSFSFYDFFIGLFVVSLSIIIVCRLFRIGGSDDD